MQKRISQVFRYIIPLALAVLLLYYAFRNIDLDEFLSRVHETNFMWVYASIVLSLAGYILRAYRWNLLLKPLGYYVNTYRTTLAVLVGYLANLAFPRLGEVTRCAILKKTDHVPLTLSLGTVITERIIDTITLFLLITLSFLLEFELITTFMVEALAGLQLNVTTILVVSGAAIGLAVLVFYFILLKSTRLAVKIREFLRGLYKGVLSIKGVENPVLFILSTVLLWVIYYLMAY
ncbi:MAG: flippase-like domain-containing protein, partial [Cyclobacteriaceae bacterium]|nr:flippase-like domain-containing protein [Cyclobacteriaceae bacterium]